MARRSILECAGKAGVQPAVAPEMMPTFQGCLSLGANRPLLGERSHLRTVRYGFAPARLCTAVYAYQG